VQIARRESARTRGEGDHRQLLEVLGGGDELQLLLATQEARIRDTASRASDDFDDRR
jgi:hypothetical protein